VLAYGVHDLQEAGVLPGLGVLAFDVSAVIPPDSWYGTLLKGTVNFSPATTWLQAIVWCAYVVPVMTVFIRTLRKQGRTTSVQKARATQEQTTQDHATQDQDGATGATASVPAALASKGIR
jgi:high-affinity iron transporter